MEKFAFKFSRHRVLMVVVIVVVTWLTGYLVGNGAEYCTHYNVFFGASDFWFVPLGIFMGAVVAIGLAVGLLSDRPTEALPYIVAGLFGLITMRYSNYWIKGMRIGFWRDLCAFSLVAICSALLGGVSILLFCASGNV